MFAILLQDVLERHRNRRFGRKSLTNSIERTNDHLVNVTATKERSLLSKDKEEDKLDVFFDLARHVRKSFREVRPKRLNPQRREVRDFAEEEVRVELYTGPAS